MPQHYSGRVLVILTVLLVALVAIFWPSVASPRQVGFNRDLPLSAKLNLRPGIDIVGGTSLLYEIQQPENAPYNPNLAADVMTALKRRVDPSGVMNLIWRPQGSNRLEIQMPFSTASGDTAKNQKALDQARTALEATNVKVSDAVAAVEKSADPQARQAALDKLAAGLPERKKILDEMAAAFDAIQKADAEQDVNARITAEENYLKAQQKLGQTNLSVADLERTLGLKASRQAALDKLKKDAAAYPARLKAIESYLAAAAALERSPGGLESAADLKRLLRGSGVLEFHILASAFPNVDMQQWIQRLKTEGPRVKAGDEYRWFEVEKPEEFKGYNTVEYNDRHWVLASIRPEDSLDKRTGEWALANAYRTSDQLGVPVVGFQFNTFGGKFFGDLTSKHVQKPMAIMLDGRVISAPNIQEPITGGSGTINGGQDGFSAGELEYLIRMLSAGSLPAQLAEEPISERTVGPQLGEDNLRRGLLACGLGLIVVAIFLIGYYYLSGVVAFVAVVLNLVILLGAMAAINATFTLPGIAALILTVGSAVDANVLIFERLREEQARGLSLRLAVRNAYDRAFSAIFDSNMTALITSLFLILFGTEEVKGFGITLIIGILASLFTSLFVTKTIFGILIERFNIRRLGSLPMSFPKWDRMLRPDINWMKYAWAFGAFSFVVVALGVFLFVKYIRAGQMFDIEFASGTAVTFEIKTPQKQEEVRAMIDRIAKERPQALPAPSVVRVGEEGTTWEVTTPNPDSRAVRDAILAAVGSNLKAELPSTFKGLNDPTDAAVKKGLIIPLNTANLTGTAAWPNQFIPPEAREHSGGAAILLSELNPHLSANQINERMKRQVLQDRGVRSAAQQGTQAASPEFTVVGVSGNGAAGADAPVASALILASNPDLPYEKDPVKWQDGVAAPIWTLATEAVSHPANLQQVKNFDASVAGDTQRDALIAMTLSMLAIMAYVWFRFGNLKYGTATVIALVHDVAFCLAGIGFSHALSTTPVGEWLLLEPFRINLTVVAGILTVMGYSMLDTIVVFDRIRELRGKYGHLSAKVVNDGINQTLSRTLLTAGTTVISLAIMYFVGGPGIHGFTFVLFVGILVGTYSSIAIAAPILLVGRAPEETGGKHRGRPEVTGRIPRAGVSAN